MVDCYLRTPFTLEQFFVAIESLHIGDRELWTRRLNKREEGESRLHWHHRRHKLKKRYLDRIESDFRRCIGTGEPDGCALNISYIDSKYPDKFFLRLALNEYFKTKRTTDGATQD